VKWLFILERNMRLASLSIPASLTLLAMASSVSAAVTFDWVTVGNPGNSADTRFDATGYGSVDYTYRISQTEVTNSQYTAFLNAVDPTGAKPHSLYDTRMSDNSGNVSFTGGIDYTATNANGSKYSVKTGYAKQPAVWISWNDAARFVNWLSNGQGAGSTETGVYNMSLSTPTRAPDATIFLPTESEWYKAAYYDPTLNGTGGYYTYATQSDTEPYSDNPASLDFPDNSANYYKKTGASGEGYNDGYALTQLSDSTPNSSTDYLTDVGAYSDSTSYYGTFDQSGNVWEWSENGIIRGGAWYNNIANLAASTRFADTLSHANFHYGFRIASLPEPTSGVLLLGLAGAALVRRRRA
jgi:formylglycine-generating enzyme required for sulfatase activity